MALVNSVYSCCLHRTTEKTSHDGGKNTSLLQLRAGFEKLHQQLHAIHEVMIQLNLEEDTQCTGGGSVDGSCIGSIERFGRCTTRGYCDKKQAMGTVF